MTKRRWQLDQMESLAGRTAVITGGNQGLGFVTARYFAKAGAKVVLAVRNEGKGLNAAANLTRTIPTAEVEIVKLDLSDQASVHEAARQLLDQFPAIDYLINNAGLMAVPRSETVDGFESQLATNHLGHFTLTAKLMPALTAAHGRVVAVSSLAAREGSIRFDDMQFADKYDRWEAYRQSKVANLMFALELAERCDEVGNSVTATAAHPGISATNLGSGLQQGGNLWTMTQATMFSLAGQSPEQGAIPIMYAAAGGAENGSFTGPNGFGEFRGRYPAPAMVPALAADSGGRRLLWERSTALTGVSAWPS